MKRREFITMLGGAAAAWPLTARAQQSAMPVIGFLSSRSAEDSVHLVDGWRRGLNDVGLAESHDFSVEQRWADGRYERLSELANELVRRPCIRHCGSGRQHISACCEDGEFNNPHSICCGD